MGTYYTLSPRLVYASPAQRRFRSPQAHYTKTVSQVFQDLLTELLAYGYQIPAPDGR